eukprot:766298-Hanusia_phi.AAC.4
MAVVPSNTELQASNQTATRSSPSSPYVVALFPSYFTLSLHHFLPLSFSLPPLLHPASWPLARFLLARFSREMFDI